MSDILIIGGGFAGVWSAAAAARVRERTGHELSITLLTPGDDLVIRPRLYEANPQMMRVPLEPILGPIKVRQHAATVTEIDSDRRRVIAVDRDGGQTEFDYRRLILAAGSQLRRPDVPGGENLYDVDTLAGAVKLDAHLRSLPAGPGRLTAVVVGAGFTGIELATELIGRLREVAIKAGDDSEAPQVILVDRADAVGSELGSGPRPVIVSALATLGIQTRLGQTLTSLTADRVRFSDGTELAARTVVWTGGMQASPLTKQIPGERDSLGRLHVDEYLRIPNVPTVFAAGDTAAAMAEPGHAVMQSCQHAIPLGKYAGHNAAAELLGGQVARFEPEPYVTCLDLGPAGAVRTTGYQRAVVEAGQQAKQTKRFINEQLIYPPLDDPAELLRMADYRTDSAGVAIG